MAGLKSCAIWTVLLLFLCEDIGAKLADDSPSPGTPVPSTPGPSKLDREVPVTPEVKTPKKMTITEGSGGAAMLFADELKMTLDRYLFGICPQTFKMQLGRSKNASVACDLDFEQQELAGRFATLALRAHSAARSDCSRFGAAVANTLGELARTAANRHASNMATAEANKKKKLSKAAKAKLEAKQRTALAVKKKAAAAAAKMAAKMAAAAS